MPVILADGDIDAWMLGEGQVENLLVPAPDELLIATPVSPRANSVKNDDPGALEEVVGQTML